MSTKEERFVSAHTFSDFSLWCVGPVAFGLQQSMVISFLTMVKSTRQSKLLTSLPGSRQAETSVSDSSSRAYLWSSSLQLDIPRPIVPERD